MADDKKQTAPDTNNPDSMQEDPEEEASREAGQRTVEATQIEEAADEDKESAAHYPQRVQRRKK